MVGMDQKVGGRGAEQRGVLTLKYPIDHGIVTDLQRRLWSDAVRSDDATVEHGNDVHTDVAMSGQRWRLSDERQLCGDGDQVHLRRRLRNDTVRCDDATVGH